MPYCSSVRRRPRRLVRPASPSMSSGPCMAEHGVGCGERRGPHIAHRGTVRGAGETTDRDQEGEAENRAPVRLWRVQLALPGSSGAVGVNCAR
jgi:hypothetical protein